MVRQRWQNHNTIDLNNNRAGRGIFQCVEDWGARNSEVIYFGDGWTEKSLGATAKSKKIVLSSLDEKNLKSLWMEELLNKTLYTEEQKTLMIEHMSTTMHQGGYPNMLQSALGTEILMRGNPLQDNGRRINFFVENNEIHIREAVDLDELDVNSQDRDKKGQPPTLGNVRGVGNYVLSFDESGKPQCRVVDVRIVSNNKHFDPDNSESRLLYKIRNFIEDVAKKLKEVFGGGKAKPEPEVVEEKDKLSLK